MADMDTSITNINEQQAATAFSSQAKKFDDLFSGNSIIQYKRKRVRDHAQQYLLPKSNVLELNSGTGEDAIWFAQQGHHVHATDISAGMQEVLLKKVKEYHLETLVSNELRSFTALNNLKNKGPYDLIFSNFAGLNCTGDLRKVLHSFESLLNPGGIITLVILPSFCLWEFLLLFKGKFNTAFRRLFSKRGVQSNVEGNLFTCWYYNPSYIINELKNEFDLLSIEGLCTIVPPSYIENFAEKYPGAYNYLKSKEDWLKKTWPWKFIGDYYIISLKKKG
jgi:ubiquinone/menaquinone biosynthesis C-methylase UbiE